MLRKINLAEIAYEKLVKKIVTGAFPAGELLREEKLSVEFKISRTPVREALRRLAAEGLVQKLPRGFRSASLDSSALAELFQCRCGLELLALSSALPLIPEKCISTLIRKLDCISTKKNPRETLLQIDRDMHDLIRNFCGNRYLSELIGQFLLKTSPWRSFRNYECESIDSLAVERLEILRALHARDLKSASGLLHAHILRGMPDPPI